MNSLEGATPVKEAKPGGWHMKASENDRKEIAELAHKLGTGKSEAVRIAVRRMLGELSA